MILITVNARRRVTQLFAINIAVGLEIEIVLAIFAVLREAIFVRDILYDLNVEPSVQRVRLAPRAAEHRAELPRRIVQLDVEEEAIALGEAEGIGGKEEPAGGAQCLQVVIADTAAGVKSPVVDALVTLPPLQLFLGQRVLFAIPAQRAIYTLRLGRARRRGRLPLAEGNGF